MRRYNRTFKREGVKRHPMVFRDLYKRGQGTALATFERVVVVRNPFARLYSAWHNKFFDGLAFCQRSDRDAHPYCVQWGNLARLVVRAAAVSTAGVNVTRPVELMGLVTWPAFLNATMFHGVNEPHWTLQVSNYDLCTLSPTHVITAEHADEDMALLLRKLGSNITLPHLNRSSEKVAVLQAATATATATASTGASAADTRSLSRRDGGGTVAQHYANAAHLARVQEKFVYDFVGLAYSTDISCAVA
jgi:hypothetical protein